MNEEESAGAWNQTVGGFSICLFASALHNFLESLFNLQGSRSHRVSSVSVWSGAGNAEIRPEGTHSEAAIEVNHGPLLELFICEM